MHVKSIHFQQERAADLSFLCETLALLGEESRSLDNCFPTRNHLRRTRSFRKRQLPRRLKLNPTIHHLKRRRISFESRCRKHRRRAHIIFQHRSLHHSNSETVEKWLETHIWHAKRMRMSSLWNFKLPLHSCGRGPKSIGKPLKESAIIHDESYIRPIQILGASNSVFNLVRQFTVHKFLMIFTYSYLLLLGSQSSIVSR